MATFFDFIALRAPNVSYVVVGMVLIHASSALMGTFALLRKRVLIGDAVAHALLPGLCLGFLWAGEKDIVALSIGSFLTGWGATFAIDGIVALTKLKQDAAIGVVLSVFFAVGMVLLTYIQKNAIGAATGLDHFLWGQSAAIQAADLPVYGGILLLVVGVLVVFYRSFVTVAFHREFAASVGLPVRGIEALMRALTVLTIAAGIQALGVILMAALIITPAAAARFWSDRLPVILLLAVPLSVLSGIGGAYVSYAKAGMPTGPWTVVFLSGLMGCSAVFAPQKGALARHLRARRNRLKISQENILKAMYHYHELKGSAEGLNAPLTAAALMGVRRFDTHRLVYGLHRLWAAGLLSKEKAGAYRLTEEGKRESRRIVRLHRLWEHYLLKRTSIAADHVHPGAEAIEHLISPELERELEAELGIRGIPKKEY